MFGFFKKVKPAASNEMFRRCAQEAIIESVLENGSYSGFLIRTSGDAAFLNPRVSNADSIAAFVNTVETRIKNGDFDDLRGREMGLTTHDSGRSTAMRIVIGEEQTPLFNWPGPESVALPNSTQVDAQLSHGVEKSKAHLVKEFGLSFFHVKIETNADGGLYPFKLTATDSRTNMFAFSYGLEISPFASCLVSVSADGMRVNMGPPLETITLESFDNLAAAFAIEKIYDDQLVSDAAMNSFGAYALAKKIGKEGFQILALNGDDQDSPQIIAMKDGETVGVIVRAGAFPHKGTLWDRTEEELKQLIARYQERGQGLYFASVTLSNANARNEYERRVLLRNGSFRMSVEEFRRLQEVPKLDTHDRLAAPELAIIGEYGALVATDLADKIALPPNIEEIVHPEYSIFGVYMATRAYLDFTEKNDEILSAVLAVLTVPPFMNNVGTEGDEEVERFEHFAGAAVFAYEQEAARFLKAGASKSKNYAEFGRAAARVMLARMMRYKGFEKSSIRNENMQEAIAMQPEVLEVSFQEMRDAGVL